jgi:hypothetical protein
VGGRWSVSSNEDSGPDLLLFNEGDTSGVYTHELYCASVAFADRILGGAEIAALGGPKVGGTFVPSFAPKPTLSITSSGGGNATVSWSTNFIGYALEQAGTVAAPQWKPVAGITNNSVTLAPAGTARCFRLVQ